MLNTKAVVAGMLMLILMSFQVAGAAPRSKLLKMRQPHKVSAVNKTWLRELSQDLYLATASAENLDAQVSDFVKQSGMGWFAKWNNGIDETRMQRQFADEMSAHLKTMTVLFKKHTSRKKFDEFREFEFRNLVRRSDYILSLSISRNSLERGLASGNAAEEFKKVLGAYNHQRLRFDQKMISVAIK